MCSTGNSEIGNLKLKVPTSATTIAVDLRGMCEWWFMSALDQSPIMVTWDRDFEEWDVYYYG